MGIEGKNKPVYEVSPREIIKFKVELSKNKNNEENLEKYKLARPSLPIHLKQGN
jgi:hypothetical protein